MEERNKGDAASGPPPPPLRARILIPRGRVAAIVHVNRDENVQAAAARTD